MSILKELTQKECVPSHDTFSRMLWMESFEELAVSQGSWLEKIFPEICRKYERMKILHIDEKAVRVTSEKSRG